MEGVPGGERPCVCACVHIMYGDCVHVFVFVYVVHVMCDECVCMFVCAYMLCMVCAHAHVCVHVTCDV